MKYLPDDQETPAERYADLDPSVREMLESLRPEEVQLLQKMIRTASSFGVVGRVIVYAGGALFALIVLIPGLVDAIARIAGWLHLAPKP